MKQGKWIWLDTPVQSDEYGNFYDVFTYVGGKIFADISVAGDYALYVNDRLVGFGQYADYAKRKIYDTLDLTPFVQVGENQVKIVAWYIGLDCFTGLDLGRGLCYSIYTHGEILTASRAGLSCALSTEYVSYGKKKITVQVGYSYTYDARKETETVLSAVEVDGFVGMEPRPNEKLRFGEHLHGVLCDEKKRIYDLGKECCGLLKLRFFAPRGEKIRITYGEHLKDGRVRDVIGGRDFSVTVIGSGKEEEIMPLFRRLGCRYLQVYASAETKVYAVGIQETEYPFRVVPYKVENPLRKQIYETSLRTLQLSAHEHYEDCPWREQAMYIEDSRNQMLCGYYGFDNLEFPRAAILSILQGQRDDGLFELCFPASCEFTIPSFSLVLPAVVLEYVQFSKDTALLASALPALERMMAFFLGQVRENGLFKTVGSPTLWHFYEWAGDLDGNFFADDEKLRYRNQYDVLINAFIAWACENMSALCACLSENEKAVYYKEKQVSINVAVNGVFWSESRQMYRTYEGREEYSQLANAMCILCGACPKEWQVVVADKLAYGCDGWVKNTLSMNLFRFDALLKVDMVKYAPVVLAIIDEVYGKMLAEDATSFWETEAGEADFDGAGSLCHGWSAIPVYYYHRLGVCK